MNGKVVLSFVLGAAAGVAASWYYLKNKYERISQEEIASMRVWYRKRYSNNEDSLETVESKVEREMETDNVEDETMVEYKTITSKYGQVEEKEGGQKMYNDCVVVTPEEFDGYRELDEFADYECETLTYYANGVLTDDWGNVIENVDELVGEESLTHFGEYEQDSVYVRNDALNTYYEILRDLADFVQ